jgi:hypothetical protein
MVTFSRIFFQNFFNEKKEGTDEKFHLKQNQKNEQEQT